MNRRSFITKALAGLAAIPVLSKIAQAVESGYNKPIPTVYGALPFTSRPVWSPHYHIVTVKIADAPMTMPKSFRVSDEHGDHEFEPMRIRTECGRTELTGAIYRCLDADTCHIGCPVTLYQERVMWRDLSGNGNHVI